MDYEHHIFVSYARGDLWTPWVLGMFVPRLKGYLLSEVGSAEVFADNKNQTSLGGADRRTDTPPRR